MYRLNHRNVKLIDFNQNGGSRINEDGQVIGIIQEIYAACNDYYRKLDPIQFC